MIGNRIRAHILRGPYLSAGEINPVLNRFAYLTEEAVPTVSLTRVLLGEYLRYTPLNWDFISFQINRIELRCKEITASSYVASG